MSYCEISVTTPPIPEASTTPSRSGSTVGVPASAHASCAAISANCCERSKVRARTRSSTSLGSTATVAPMRTGRSSAQPSVSERTPDLPASIADQVDATSPPSGVVAPSPVTRTVGRVMTSGRDAGRLDVLDGVADRAQVARGLVRDANAEALFRGHEDLDHRQRVDLEVVDERLVHLDVVLGHAGDLFDDLGHAAQDFG